MCYRYAILKSPITCNPVSMLLSVGEKQRGKNIVGVGERDGHSTVR